VTIRIVAAIAALVAAIGLLGVFGPAAPHVLSASVVVMAVLAWWRPGDALVVLTALAPLGEMLSLLSGTPETWTLPLALAVVAGAGVRAIGRIDSDRDWTAAGAAWTATVLASLVVGLLEDARGGGPGYWSGIGHWMASRFPVADPLVHSGIYSAALAIIGVQLALLAAREVRHDPAVGTRLVRAALLGGAGVGALSAYRVCEIALRAPSSSSALLEIVRGHRINVAFRDLNAASALYLMLLPIAMEGFRVKTLRPWALASAPFLLVGLWLAGSRAALVLVPVLAGVMVWLRSGTRLSGRQRVLAGAAALVVGVLFVVAHPRSAESFGPDNALGVRAEMALATGRMVATAPAFGVGIGQYRAISSGFMSSRMREWYKAENAHNQFLQVLGELGVTGLLAFGALLALALTGVTRLARTGAVADGVTGTVIGLWAFLIASLTMHPLLVPEVGMVFWVLLGVARGSGPPTAHRWLESAVLWWVVILALTLPMRVSGALS
jgi:O-antigen ligase